MVQRRNRRNHGKEFDSYLTKFRRRFKLRIIFTALAAVTFSVLTVSLLTAILKNSLADSNWLYYPARAALLIPVSYTHLTLPTTPYV